jgi:6-phosphofructokinase 1
MSHRRAAGEELLGESTEKDASGNKILPKIGEFMKSAVEEYFTRHGEVATVKYIDPSYMVRSVPANAADSLYCMQLAQNAVHGAMAGFTGFSVGLCNNRMVWLPIPELVATSPRSMNPRGRTWERVLTLTRQPNTVPPLQPGEEVKDSHAPMLR